MNLDMEKYNYLEVIDEFDRSEEPFYLENQLRRYY